MLYFILSVVSLLIPNVGYSHHPLNGLIMQNFNDGFLSGIGHPILGLDHLTFIIGIGLISYLSSRFFNYSITFIGGTFLGLFSIIFGFYLPFYEIIISFTLLLLGYFILVKDQIRYKEFLILLFGVFHGWAYGAIFSDEVKLSINVLLGYSIGLFLTQLLIIYFAFKLFRFLLNFRVNGFSIVPVFSGLLIGIATVSLFETIESNILNIFK